MSSLKETWHQAEQLRKQYEQDYAQVTLLQALRSYRAAQSLISRLSLFSTNESLEDVSSTDLEFFLAEYHLGVLLFQVSDRPTRPQSLQQAEVAFTAFLTRCDDYAVADQEERDEIKVYLKRGHSGVSSRAHDPARQREERIARYKREQALQAQIDANATVGMGDEESSRRLSIAAIRLAVSKSLQELEGINREAELLKTLPDEPLRDKRREEEAKEDAKWRLDRTKDDMPIIDSHGRPLRPFVITSERMRSEVFRPGHSLPTLSIDEYLELEEQRGGIVRNAAEQQQQRVTGEEDERRKAIAWDEFVENNPKGLGNTMNRG